MSFYCDGCGHNYSGSPVRTATKFRKVIYHIQLVGKRGNERNIMSKGEEIAEEKDFCKGCYKDFKGARRLDVTKEVNDKTKVNRKIGV